MLRHLILSFERALLLQTANASLKQQSARSSLFVPFESTTKKLHAAALNTQTSANNEISNSTVGTEIDQDYVKPYKVHLERGTNTNVLINALKERFRLTDDDVEQILSDDNVHRTYRERSLEETLDELCLNGITKRSILEYPWILTLDIKRLSEKLHLINLLEIRDFNDFVPFLRLSVPRLRKLVSALNREAKSLKEENRVYYISEKLQMDTQIVTKYLAKRLFVLEMPFEMFDQNLQHMLDYNVPPLSILKDLWAFRYTPKAVQLRLERAKRAKKDKIMPWMVRCTEPILQRSLKLSLDELRVLGEFSTVVEYLAHRLEFSAADAKAIMDKHPQVHTVRVTKVKEILDYLLNEAGFSRYEVAQVPRILCHSLKTTKERFNELKSLGCRPSSLVILCRSKREYKKFLQQWQQSQKTMRSVGNDTQA